MGCLCPGSNIRSEKYRRGQGTVLCLLSRGKNIRSEKSCIDRIFHSFLPRTVPAGILVPRRKASEVILFLPSA